MTVGPGPARETSGARGAWDGVPVAAGNYERDLVPALFEPFARDLVRRARLRPGERVLDLACGTGIVARIAAPRVGPAGAVTGVDVNEDMLAVARRAGTAANPAIEWRRASALATGLPDGAFDVGFCQQGLQFFPDWPAALHELHRVLAPGGRVAVGVWSGVSPGYAPLMAALERHLPEVVEAAGFIRAIFSLGDAGELHDLLTGSGFRDVQIRRRTRTVRFLSAEAWVQAFLGAAPIPGIATLESSVRDLLAGEVVGALQAYVDGHGLSFPTSANLAVARRP